MAVNENMESVVLPYSYEKAVKEMKWKEAMINELSNIDKRNVWEEIEVEKLPHGTKCLGTKWVYAVEKVNYFIMLHVL